MYLLAGSYWFYAGFGLLALPLLLLMTGFNFALSSALDGDRSRRDKALMSAAVVGNASVLVLFKVAIPLASLNVYSAPFSAALAKSGGDIALPAGLSFYTFHAISYFVDIRRAEIKPRRDLVDFATYLAFFPQLTAGPLARAHEFFHEHDNRKINLNSFSLGTAVFTIGLIKKVVIADFLDRTLVDPIFADIHRYHVADVFISCLAFNFQVYYDFSGYCDMAVGVGLALGYHLPKNFNNPFLATSIREHWSRWHISLSTWIRDYIYFPLGGSRKGKFRKYVNITVCMMIVAFWHGINPGMLYWGIFISVALILSHLTHDRFKGFRRRTPFFLQCMGTLTILSFGRLLYRVGTADGLASFFGRLPHVDIEYTFRNSSLFSYLFLAFVIAQHVAARMNFRATAIACYMERGILTKLAVLMICGYYLIYNAPPARSFIYHHF